ncbi:MULTISPECIES: FAD-dependent oxidoreductase [unclassified Neomoorella]|uniref:FAD-dependent oxidoreductase n=1 Tax=unclassified Neomoorella TaxID=2676739 RepID=UPI001C0EE706|nr:MULTISPECIES: FAD-dependent oxidoreductase [unclassified Moorella (in: firmicutes)]
MLSLSGTGIRPEGWPLAAPAVRADIVVYGGGLAGCAAAWKAAATAPDRTVVLVVPYPEHEYGGLATVGGQNFWDVRYWARDGRLAQGGSFAHWFKAVGPFYRTADLSAQIAADLGRLPNLHTYWAMDITAIQKDRRGRLKTLALRELQRDAAGTVIWGEERLILAATIFVDASEDGRLSRLSHAGVTVGRADWPADLLAGDFIDLTLRPRQQAATLMFKVRGVQPGRYRDMIFRQERGVWSAYGGREVYINDTVVTAFNDRYGPAGFALKPLNAVQDGPGNPEWWVNALLIFNVDGRANARDRGHDAYPGDMAPEALDTDTAWQRAREMLANPDFIRALRRFDGFHEAEVVLDADGKPFAGGMLYLRETIHTVVEPREAGPGTEDSNYALTAAAAHGAGPGPAEGNDLGNYVNRIGLGFYWQDINAYHFSDLKGGDGRYRWPVTPFLRPDYPRTMPGPGGWPQNPVYIPFNTLLSRPVPNLLIPGYAASISSLAWAELRVLPNQCVLGDAAGVAAAYAVMKGRDPGTFTDADVAAVREILVQCFGVRVDK